MAAIAAVAQGVTGAVGSIVSGIQQSDAADYNAKVAKRQAAWETMRSKALADRQAEQDRKLLASQRAHISAGGLDPSEATPLQLLTETAAQANVDYRNILLDGQMRADNLRSQASAYKVQGRNALIGSAFGATSQLAEAASQYGQYQDNLAYQNKMMAASQYGQYQDNLAYQNKMMTAYTNGRGQLPPSVGSGWNGGGLGVGWLRR